MRPPRASLSQVPAAVHNDFDEVGGSSPSRSGSSPATSAPSPSATAAIGLLH